MSNRLGEWTRLFAAVATGDAKAQERLWELLYRELYQVACTQAAEESNNEAHSPTSLVHEVFIRLHADGRLQWVNRRYFFAAAARIMRRVRVDQARARLRDERCMAALAAQAEEIRLESKADPLCPAADREAAFPVGLGMEEDAEQLLLVDSGLNELERVYPRAAEAVLLHYFVGLGGEEIARLIGVSARTVDMDLRFARAWLRRAVSGEQAGNSPEYTGAVAVEVHE